jgi:hypothetical protein
MFSKNIMNKHLFYDDFVCNAVSNVDRDDPDIDENCRYAQAFPELQRQETNHTNANEVFKRNWLQIFNLILGNGLLILFIKNKY